MDTEETISQEVVAPGIRDEAGRFTPGHSGNPSGRPKGTMKDYLRRKFMELSDSDKEKFLIDNKVTGVDQIKLAEGNPANETDITSDGQALQPILVRFIDGEQPEDNKYTE